VTLRRRLALTLVLTAVPLFLGFAWARLELLKRYEVQVIRDLVVTRAASLGRERCESTPEELLPPPGRGLGPPGPPLGRPEGELPPPPEGAGPVGPPPGPRPGAPPRVPVRAFVYDGAFQAVDPAAPVFPPELRRTLEGGSEYAARRFATPGRGEGLDVAVRTGWTDSRCAVILARRIGPPPASSLGLVWGALPLLVLLLASVLVAAGPMVGRIRALTTDVRRSADTLYEAKVRADGSDEIAELARAFNEAGAKVRVQLGALEERDRTLRAFLADTTHDVMIPLTVLVGHLSNLRKRLAAKGAVEEADLLPALQEVQYLASLIHNLGAAAKLEAGEPLVERHPVDLGALVERVVERHRPVAEPAGIAVEFGVPEGPVVVEGDVTLIEQAVSNIVHNAVRYNRQGGHVAVLLEETAAPAGFRLRVVDDGPGVPESELQRLGERRRRGDEARQRQPGGLGLGLHIAFGVAERHGFRMSLARSEYGGLEVTITGALGSAGRA
jgi:signal transduction histidine kinase